jgi:hypothetical protein
LPFGRHQQLAVEVVQRPRRIRSAALGSHQVMPVRRQFEHHELLRLDQYLALRVHQAHGGCLARHAEEYHGLARRLQFGEGKALGVITPICW